MADNKYFSKVKLLDGSYAEVYDAVAREAIAGGTHFIGVTTTPLENGQTIASVLIDGETVTLKNGDLMLYGSKEFIFASVDGKVHEFGDMSALKALAYKDSAEGSYTPAGTIDKPAVTVTPTTSTIKEVDAVGEVVTDTIKEIDVAGSVTPGTIKEVDDEGSVVDGTPNVPTAVTLPTLATTLNGTTLEFAWIPGSVTPGSANVPTSVTMPTTKNTTVVTGATMPTTKNTTVVTGATMPTTKNATVVTGVAAELAAAPAFTGTAATITVS